MDAAAVAQAKAYGRQHYAQVAFIDPPTMTQTQAQAKITAAGVGASIMIGFGTLNVSGSPLTPLNGQTWWGPGTIKGDGTSDVILLNGRDRVTLKDLTIDGGWTTTLTGNPGPGLNPVSNAVNMQGSTRCRMSGRISNIQGSAVRVYDSSHCKISDLDIYNAYYGVLLGSGGQVADPGGGSHYNKIVNVECDTIAKNAFFVIGNTASNTGNPNLMAHNQFSAISAVRFGDTGIEIGQGSYHTSVTGLTLDGGDETPRLNGWAFNGILLRDCHDTSVRGFSIKNIWSYTNGSGAFLSLGNGIFMWPMFTGQITDVSIGGGVIENVTRGVFVQGNNTTFDATNIAGGAGTISFADGVSNGTTTYTSASAIFSGDDAGKTITGTNIPAGTTIASVTNATTVVLSQAATGTGTALSFSIFARKVYASVSLSDIVVHGTGLGVLDGSYTGFLSAIASHGFYIQSSSGVTVVNCHAHDCQNHGFLIGDTATGSSFATDVQLVNCRARNNGKQAVGGQTYYGFFLNGTSAQANIRLFDCFASDTQISGTKTQSYAFGWNGSGSGGQATAAALYECYGTGNATGTFNNIGAATMVVGTVNVSGGNITVAASDETVIYTGTGGNTATLPSGAVAGFGRRVHIRNQGSGALTVARSGTAVLWVTSLAAGTDHVYVSDGGSNWY